MRKRQFEDQHEREDGDIGIEKRQQLCSSLRRVCVKVPSTKEKLLRAVYESVDGANGARREAWLDKVLGEKGVYVGRPKNDGGWFQARRVKQGSFLANPFSVKEYGLEQSLELYEKYLRTRLDEDCTVEILSQLLPKKDAKAAMLYYITQVGKGPGKSTSHYELNIFGKEFKERLLDLDGRTLGCFCEPPSPCHVDIILKLIGELRNVEPVDSVRFSK